MPSCFNKKPSFPFMESYSSQSIKTFDEENGRKNDKKADNKKTGRTLPLISLLAFSIGLSACSVLSPPSMPKGSIMEKGDIQALKVGSSSKADVIDILGSPTAYATFDPNNWIYISLMTKLVPLSYPGITKQKVVSLYFNDAGTLTKIQELGKKDAKHVAMVSDETPTPGTKTDFFQQLLGNIGQYSPLSAMGLGSTFGPSNGGTGPFANNPLTSGGAGSSGNTLP